MSISVSTLSCKGFRRHRWKSGHIASDALEPDPREQRQELSFPVTIRIDQQQLLLKNGASLPLQVGMSLTANIKLRSVSYLQLLLGRFKDAAASLNHL